MDPVTVQILLALAGTAVGWLLRHVTGQLVNPSAPKPTVPSPTPAPAPVPNLPTGVGHGQILEWLLQQLAMDLPTALSVLAAHAKANPLVK